MQTAPKASDAATASRLDQAVQYYAGAGPFTGSLLVARDGKVRGDKLWAGGSGSGSGRWRWGQLKAASENLFFHEKLRDVSIEIIRNGAGNAASIVMHNLGTPHPAVRLAD